VITDGGTSREFPLPGTFGILATAAAGEPANPSEPSANVGQAITVNGLALSANQVVVFPVFEGSESGSAVGVSLFDIAEDQYTAKVKVPNNAVSGPVRLRRPEGLDKDTVFLQIVPNLESVVFAPGRYPLFVSLNGSGFTGDNIWVEFPGAGRVDVSSQSRDGYQVTVPVPFRIERETAMVVTAGGRSPEVAIVFEGAFPAIVYKGNAVGQTISVLNLKDPTGISTDPNITQVAYGNAVGQTISVLNLMDPTGVSTDPNIIQVAYGNAVGQVISVLNLRDPTGISTDPNITQVAYGNAVGQVISVLNTKITYIFNTVSPIISVKNEAEQTNDNKQTKKIITGDF